MSFTKRTTLLFDFCHEGKNWGRDQVMRNNHKNTKKMAILQQPKTQSRIKIEGLAPKGVYIATCIEVEDAFGVQRPKFDDPQTMEIVDLTWFYFGYKNKAGEMFIVRSKPFKLSLHEKSALFQFLKAWRGEPPTSGFNTESMIGQGAQITIEHGMSAKGKTFSNIGSISPVLDGLEKKVVPVEMFAPYLEPRANTAPQPAPTRTATAAIDADGDNIPF